MALYGTFLILLIYHDYSHLILIPFVAALIGLGLVFRGTASPRIQERSPLFDLTDGTLFVLIVTISLGVSTHNLLSWYFANIGDEWAFFQTAINLTKNPTINIFSYRGVYGKFTSIQEADCGLSARKVTASYGISSRLLYAEGAILRFRLEWRRHTRDLPRLHWN